MKKLKLVSLFLFCFILTSLSIMPPALALEDPVVGAEAVVLIEANTGQVFYQKNENARVYPASLTKIMTVLLAVEACEAGSASPTSEVAASENITYDLIEDGSTQNIVPGEIMTLEDLMYCALVASANEACNIIAEHIGGTISNFVSMMNERALELGCTGTRFTNAHGIPDEGHYTTAWDMYLISQEAVKHSLFMTICNTKSIEIPLTNISAPRVLQNTNALLGDNDDVKGYTYEYAKGVKTGHTSAAGYCLVSTALKDNINLIAVVMGGKLTDNGGGAKDFGNFSDSITLYEWVFNNFSYQNLLLSTETIDTLPVEMGSEDAMVSLRPESAITLLLPNDVDMNSFQRSVTIFSQRDGQPLQAPVAAGEILGEISVVKDGELCGTINLVAGRSVGLSKMYFIKTEIRKALDKPTVKLVIVLLVLLGILYIAYIISYKIRRTRHVRSVREARQARAMQQARAAGGYGARDYPLDEDFDDYFEGDLQDAYDASQESKQLEAIRPDREKDANRDFFEEFFK